MSAMLLVISFLSGLAALVFEVLWFRLAGLSLGNSVWSATLVLAAFMAGLSLGNAFIARRYSRIVNPLRLYAWLELAIGIGGVAAVLVLPRLIAVLAPLFVSIADLPWVLNALRVGIAFIVLVTPATAMGATLPVLTEALSRQTPNFGASLGSLYGCNTLGAMLGAICAEAVLVRFLGIAASGLGALVVNLTACFLALRIADAYEPRAAAAAVGARPSLTARTYRYLAVGFLSGAVMLGLEVVGFRFLLLTRSGTVFVFALMLAVVLAGIGLGGIAAGVLARYDARSHRWLRHVSALSAALTVLTYWGFDWFTPGQIKQEPTALEFAGFAAFLMAPVALLSGIAFTLVARAVNQELGSSIRTTGIATLWNTVGSMAGSLLAGFVLLPEIGMERSFFVLAVLYAITALIAPAESGSRGWVRLGAYTAVSAAILCLVLFPFGLMQRSFFTIVQRLIGNDTLVAARESLTETIRYYRHDVYGDPHYYRLVTNDHSMAGTTLASKRYMKLYVYLPVALRTEMKTALLISFGVGSTAKALVDTASLREIDVVDISRDILDLSTVVYSGADNPLRDQRVHVTIEDGRFFLSSTTRRYDLITSEPPPPKLAGVVNLYSAEYFRLIRDHLTPGGYATYWLPAHQLTATDTLAVIKAFCNAFENCSLWSGGGLEWMLMGSNGAGEPVSADAFAAQWHDAGVAPELAALAFESPAQMGSLFIGDAEQLAAFTEHAAPVTDNYPLRLSGTIPDDQERVPLYAQLMDENARLARFRASAYVRSIWPSQLVEQSTPYFRYERMLKNKLIGDRYSDPADRFVWDGIDDMLTYTALKTLPLWLLGSDRDVLSIVSHSPRNEPRFELELAIGATAQRDFQGALAHMERYAHSAKMGLGDLSLMLYLLAKNDRTADARAMLAGMDPRLASDMSEFTAWFDARFGETQPVDVAP